MEKMTAVEWYDQELKKIDYKLQSGLINFEQCKVLMQQALEQAKEMEHKEQEELLKWAHTMFTKDAPLDYVLSEFNKLKNK